MHDLPRWTVDVGNSPAAGGREFVLANALGGFAMGCADAMNRRRYHALLVAATRPPVGRLVALSALADALVIPGPEGATARHDLTRFRFAGWGARLGTVPTRFETDCVEARWTYLLPDFGTVERRLTLTDGGNEATIEYAIRTGMGGYLEVRPLTALRDMHALTDARRDGWRYETRADDDGCEVSLADVRLSLRASVGRFNAAPDWWWNFEYEYDLARAQAGREDLFCPGTFVVECGPGETRWALKARVEHTGEEQQSKHAHPAETHPTEARRDRLARLVRDVLDRAGRAAPSHHDALARLVVASDAFIVRREVAPQLHIPQGEGGGLAQRPANPNANPRAAHFPTIIAGYPWFSDWGRDAMISLTGLLLIPGRHGEALELLTGFARLRRAGIIPNCFDETTGQPRYNTVDAPLWFIQACCDYLEWTDDERNFHSRLLPACLDIIDAYVRGTDSIRIDPADGLVCAGDERTNLTWMDAARDGVVFTPRHGKCVEVCALWLSGLRRLSAAMESSDPPRARELARRAEAVRFEESFWNDASGCLFDRLELHADAWVGVPEVRPNQVIALSLPHVPIARQRAHRALRLVREALLTPVGLRTLAPGSPGYRPRYEGSLLERDAAYHNGTVWPYLLGAYSRALARFEVNGKDEALRALGPILDHLAGRDGPLGSIAEVYDADEPRRPDGCAAQAWSVGEVLRALWLTLDLSGPENT